VVENDIYTPMHDIAMATRADKIERLLAGLVDVGWLEIVMTDGGDLGYAPTPGVCEFMGLTQMGIGIENGQWIRFD
jgi:hypothetical protein